MEPTDTAARAAIRKEIELKARKRVRVKLLFMWHLAVFAIANVAMFAINRAYSPNTQWFVWPLAGWGIALLFHGFATFGMGGVSDSMLEAEVERELARRSARS
jgi:hypothetical protein